MFGSFVIAKIASFINVNNREFLKPFLNSLNLGSHFLVPANLYPIPKIINFQISNNWEISEKNQEKIC